MSCDAVRAALVEGRALTDAERSHADLCPACAPLCGWVPAPVQVPPLRPDPAAWRARARRRAAAAALLAAGAVFGVLAARELVLPPPAPVAAVQVAPEPPPLPVDSDGEPLMTDALARIDLGGRLDSPLDPIDPLADLTTPTDLFAEALLGTGAP